MRDPERNRVRRNKGLLSISFNPLVSIPDSARTRKALEKLEFYVAIDFFLNETARFADVFLPGSLQEEDEGQLQQGEEMRSA